MDENPYKAPKVGRTGMILRRMLMYGLITLGAATIVFSSFLLLYDPLYHTLCDVSEEFAHKVASVLRGLFFGR